MLHADLIQCVLSRPSSSSVCWSPLYYSAWQLVISILGLLRLQDPGPNTHSETLTKTAGQLINYHFSFLQNTAASVQKHSIACNKTPALKFSSISSTENINTSYTTKKGRWNLINKYSSGAVDNFSLIPVLNNMQTSTLKQKMEGRLVLYLARCTTNAVYKSFTPLLPCAKKKTVFEMTT